MLVQRVVMPASRRESWTVLGDDAVPIEPVERYLAYLTDIKRSLGTAIGAATNGCCRSCSCRSPLAWWSAVPATASVRFEQVVPTHRSRRRFSRRAAGPP